MPRWTSSLVVYLLLPYLATVPPLVALGYVFARRALDATAVEVASASALQEARAIAVRLETGAWADLETRCREQVRGSANRLTVIAADGTVLCDTEAVASDMANHLRRPEVAGALRDGSGIDRRESATVHHAFIYAAERVGHGDEARVVRIAVPWELLAASAQRLDQFLFAAVVCTAAIAFLPAFAIARRLGGRLHRMAVFARAVAGGDFSRRLPMEKRDEIGALETHLDEMRVELARWFRGTQEESEKIQGILAAMVEGVVVIGTGGDVILINRQAERLFDLPEGVDYRGRHLVEMCRDPELQQLLRKTIDSRAQTAVREITLAVGDRRHLAVSVSPVGSPARKALGFVLVFHDITELKKLETMRRDFVANVSHELRTPLTAIRGYAETLLAGALEDRSRARQFLAVIDRHSERLSRLIDDLLTLSDLELGKTALKQEGVLLEVLVDEVIEVLREKAKRGGVALVKRLGSDLPLLMGDADRLQQVLINLADNAVKYTPPGGQVTISAREASNGSRPMVEVEVADTGIGIPGEDLPRLTERFYRVDKARSRELGGTGLGLAIVKHLVQAHGGQLRIASEVHVGTTVRFSVPAWQENRAT